LEHNSIYLLDRLLLYLSKNDVPHYIKDVTKVFNIGDEEMRRILDFFMEMGFIQHFYETILIAPSLRDLYLKFN
jgi:hypothetical protein